MNPSAELWNALTQASLVSGSHPDAKENSIHTPWYVQIMIGVSGWLAACFLLIFLALAFNFFWKNERMAAVMGAGLIGAAYALASKSPHNVFMQQFALAISFSGQILVAWGIIDLFRFEHTPSTIFFILGSISAALAAFFPSFIHRLFSAYAAVLLISWGLILLKAYFLPSALVCAAVAAAWLEPWRWPKPASIVEPVGYGLTLALVQIEGTRTFGHAALREFGLEEFALAESQFLLGSLLCACVFIGVVWQLLKRYGLSFSHVYTRLLLLGSILIGALSLKATGIASGLMIVFLGYANGNRILLSIGIISLVSFLSSYYYLLQNTLLTKSLILGCTGLALLLARQMLVFFAQKSQRKGERHA